MGLAQVRKLLTAAPANLIVVLRAGASGVTISFWDYFKIGAPLTLFRASHAGNR
jgi:Na+/H+ antiporter NhaD/arsenite permease-like protein